MAANDKNLITCVEFGTHSVRALHGMCDKAGNPVVVGLGQEPSDGAVCKGEIIDAQKASAVLEKALADADKSAGIVNERRNVYCIVNGSGITSRLGEGQVFIYADDHRVRHNNILYAVNKAEDAMMDVREMEISVRGKNVGALNGKLVLTCAYLKGEAPEEETK